MTTAAARTVEQVQGAVVEKIKSDVISNLPATAPNGSARALFLPSSLGEAMELAKLMSASHGMVPIHLRARPGDCLAVVMQATRWGMDPFAVANKSYFVNDRIAYEAQLVNAVVNTLAPLEGRVHIEWSGEGEKLECRVTGTIKGDPREKEVVQKLSTITTRNSPLWKQSPQQQLGYYTTRMWARLYCPEVLLGVYTPDEMDHVGPDNAIDVTPKTRRPTRSQFAERETEDLPPITEADEREADRMQARAERGEDLSGEEEHEEQSAPGATTPAPGPAAEHQPNPWLISADAFKKPMQFITEMQRRLGECRTAVDVDNLMTANAARLHEQTAPTIKALEKQAAERKAALGDG